MPGGSAVSTKLRGVRNEGTAARRLLLAIAGCWALILVSASSAWALQIGVGWRSVEQSKTTSEWNVIKHSGSSIYRFVLHLDKWNEEGCSISSCAFYDPVFRKAAENNVT